MAHSRVFDTARESPCDPRHHRDRHHPGEPVGPVEGRAAGAALASWVVASRCSGFHRFWQGHGLKKRMAFLRPPLGFTAFAAGYRQNKAAG